MTDKKIDYELGATDVGFRRVFQQGAEQVRALDDKLGGIAGIMGKVNVAFAAMAAVLAGGAVFAEGIEKTLEMTQQSMQLAKALGTNTAEASALNIALGDVYSDADTFTGALGKLTKQVRTNEGALNDLGLKTRDANGNLRDSQSLMLDAIGIINSYKEGIDRNAVAQDLFGKGAAEIVPLLRLNAEVMEEARLKTEQLGLAIGPKQAENTKQYRAAMNDVGDVLDGVKRAVGDSVMPVLTEMGVWFSETGPGMISVLRPSMQAVADVFEVVVSIAHSLLSSLTDAIGGIVAAIVGPLQGEGVDGLQLFKNALAVVGIAAQILKIGLTGAIEGIGMVIEGCAEQLRTFGRIARAAFLLDWDGVTKAWDEGLERSDAIVAKHAERIAKTNEEAMAKIRAVALGQDVAPAQPAAPAAGTKTYAGDPDGGRPKTPKASTRMQEWEAVIEAEKTAHALLQDEQGTFQAFSQAREVEYWRGVLARTDLSAAERLAVQKKFLAENEKLRRSEAGEEAARLKAEIELWRNNLDERLAAAQRAQERNRALYGADSREYQESAREIAAIERQKQQQLAQLAEQGRAARETAALAEVDFERSVADLAAQQGAITSGERLALEQGFEQQRYAIALAASQERLALLQAERDVDQVAVQAAQLRIEALQRTHQQRMSLLAQEQGGTFREAWGGAVQSLASQWQGGLAQLLQGNMKFSTAWRGMLSSIQQQFFTSVSQMGLRWIAGEAMKTGATATGTAARFALETAAAAKSIALWAATALKNIITSAWQAFASAYAAIAGIPYVGPFLAPVVAAGAAATIIGVGSRIASAEGGYDIPAGLNPVTQLHEQEMVLPKPQADVIREMAEAGGGMGGGTFTIHAVDARSFQRLLMDNASGVAGAVKHHVRNGGH